MKIHQALLSEFQLCIQSNIVMFGNIFQVYQRLKTNFLVYNFILAEYSAGDLCPNTVIVRSDLGLGRNVCGRVGRQSRVLPLF